MSCQVNHCHTLVQREKAEMGIDSSFAKTLCYDPEEVADVHIKFPVCKRQLINCLLNTWKTTGRTQKEILFTSFCYRITVFLYFQEILPIIAERNIIVIWTSSKPSALPVILYIFTARLSVLLLVCNVFFIAPSA